MNKNQFFHVFNDIFTNISQSRMPTGKIVGIENVSRKILYKIGYSKVSLGPPCSRIIFFHESSQYWKEIFLFLHIAFCFHYLIFLSPSVGPSQGTPLRGLTREDQKAFLCTNSARSSDSPLI